MRTEMKEIAGERKDRIRQERWCKALVHYKPSLACTRQNVVRLMHVSAQNELYAPRRCIPVHKKIG